MHEAKLKMNMAQLIADARPAGWQHGSRKSQFPRGQPMQKQPGRAPNKQRTRKATEIDHMRGRVIEDKNNCIVIKVALNYNRSRN